MKSLTSTTAVLFSTSQPSLRSSLLPALRPLYRARLRNKHNLVINLITTCSNLILTEIPIELTYVKLLLIL